MSDGKMEFTADQLQAIIAAAVKQATAPEPDPEKEAGLAQQAAAMAAMKATITPVGSPQEVFAEEGGGAEAPLPWMPSVGTGKKQAPATPVVTVWMPQMVTDGPPVVVNETKAAEKSAGEPSLVVGNPTADGLPPVKEMKIHSTAKLPPGARKRWNVKALTGDGQTTFEIRQGDGETEFTMTGANKELATEVIIALSLIDRTRRNAMRLALEEGYAKKHAGDPTLQSYDKYERAKLKNYLSWLRKYGAAGLDSGHRPWDGKVAGSTTPPPGLDQLLASLGVSSGDAEDGN